MNDITLLFPENPDWEEIKTLGALEPFHPEAIDFLNALSGEVMNNPSAQAFPDVISFAFFCRKAHISKLQKDYEGNNTNRLGRGILFHITPSNVPVNFAYSLISGILSGNVNIVRVPSRNFGQIEFISGAISKIAASGNYPEITKRIFLVRYDRHSLATSWISSICDVRVIWGGDETIAEIRKSPLPPRSFEVTFADRYSLCAINANKYVIEDHPETIALGFFNDTYLFDQNACTSPHLVVWTGSDENVKSSREKFWKLLSEVLNRKNYQLQALQAVDKLTALYSHASQGKNYISKIIKSDNKLWRLELSAIPLNIDELRSTAGYFLEYHATSLADLAPCINRKYQTLSYFGYTNIELQHFMGTYKPTGIDRIVPIGRTTEFSLTWDGFDLINIFSRVIELI